MGRRGFTMIELLVVLVILGLTSALVLPKFPAIYEHFQSKGEQEAFFQSLATLPLKAYTQQKNLVLDKESATSLLELPKDWVLNIAHPIVYKPNGICLGGQITYTIKGVTKTIQLLPPHCDPSVS